jgi:uncharacterized RDD family membrane protein YckC
MTTRPLASRSNRLIGQFLDGLIGAAPFIIGFALSTVSEILGGIVVLLGVAWSLFYYLFADGFTGGQSIAKRWLDMHVVDATTGAPCTFWQSFLRNVLLAVLGPIDWIFIFGGRHQRLGDMAAGTIVVAG